MKGRLIRLTYRFVFQIFDPIRLFRAVPGYKRFVESYFHYRRLGSPLPLPIAHLYPQLHDRTSRTKFDPHYLFQSNWAFRQILRQSPRSHIDVGSQVDFVSHLACVLPVMFVDIRPIEALIDGLTCVAGSILSLPFPDFSQSSVSCLHVIEHIGLGRYGDPLDCLGSEKAAVELSRILQTNGRLYLSTPIGWPRVCFNAHRIRTPKQVMDLFPGLEVEEFSVVDDHGVFVRHAEPDQYKTADYACGLFIFRRAQSIGGRV